MTHTIEIESVHAVGADELLDTFSARGLAGTVLDAGSRLCLQLELDADQSTLAGEVERALDTWIGERRLALVPQHLGGGNFVLRPPAA
jgi:hypothetical protein